MEKNKKSAKIPLFVIGAGCILLILCGLGAVAFGLVSSFGSSQSSYSVPQDSYDSYPQQYSSGGNPDELIGHWQYTKIIDSSIPLIIDYNIYFYADGTFEMDEVNEGGEHSNYSSGTWTATNLVVTLNFSSGRSVQTGYSFYDGYLIFDNDSGYYEPVGR